MILYMVLPCYNEEEVLQVSSKRLEEKFNYLVKEKKISNKSKIIFVDDGSKDSTWNKICKIVENNIFFGGIKLSKNCGHQYALLAGLMTVKDKADAVISMDADLQDDINAIDLMIEKYKNGCDIVYGVKKKRDADSKFKKLTGEGFYKVMNSMGADLVYNHADCRLMSKRALQNLADFKEVNLFLRGLIPMIGYKTDCVYYNIGDRLAGKSKYTLKKMLSFALEGITSLSTKPIKFISFLGIISFIVSLLMITYSLITYFIGHTVPGYSTIIISIWGFGGIQLISIGLIGEYIGKIYLETKQRPRYFVEEYIIKE